jgi:deazaflavin-dependent oxidoreductase (nitroreductase family)
MWMRNHVINPVVRAVAHSAAHRVLGRHLIVLGYTGRRSGRRRELPVMAAPAGTDLVVLVGQHRQKTWWRNFDAFPQQVAVRTGGRRARRDARRLLPGDTGYAEAVAAYRRQFPRSPVDVDAPLLVLADAPPGPRTRSKGAA